MAAKRPSLMASSPASSTSCSSGIVEIRPAYPKVRPLSVQTSRRARSTEVTRVGQPDGVSHGLRERLHDVAEASRRRGSGTTRCSPSTRRDGTRLARPSRRSRAGCTDQGSPPAGSRATAPRASRCTGGRTPTSASAPTLPRAPRRENRNDPLRVEPIAEDLRAPIEPRRSSPAPRGCTGAGTALSRPRPSPPPAW